MNRSILDSATTNCVGENKTYSEILFEENPDAIMEIEQSLGNIDLFTGKKKKYNPSVTRKKLTQLSLQQSQKLGDANIQYSMGNFPEALVILKVLIKENPNAFEPWLTVGTIYEEMGDIIKSQGALFMSAYLNNNAPELWKKIAKQSM